MDKKIRKTIQTQLEFEKQCMQLIGHSPSTGQAYKDAVDEVDAGASLVGAIPSDPCSQHGPKERF